MSEPLLASRVADAVAAAGLEPPRGGAAHLADLIRLVLRVTAPGADTVELVRPKLTAELERRFRLPRAVADQLVRLAAAPEFRGVLEAGAMDAFVGRFGAVAGRLLQQQDQNLLDLDGFSAEYGPEAALHLTEVLLAVLGDEAGLGSGAIRQVESAAEELGVDPVLVSALLARHPGVGGTERAFSVKGDRVRVGRSPGADVVLPDPQVALQIGRAHV